MKKKYTVGLTLALIGSLLTSIIMPNNAFAKKAKNKDGNVVIEMERSDNVKNKEKDKEKDQPEEIIIDKEGTYIYDEESGEFIPADDKALEGMDEEGSGITIDGGVNVQDENEDVGEFVEDEDKDVNEENKESEEKEIDKDADKETQEEKKESANKNFLYGTAALLAAIMGLVLLKKDKKDKKK